MEHLPLSPGLADVAQSTLFDYEVRGRPQRALAFYDFVKRYARLFDQPWQTTPEIDDCLSRLANPDNTDDNPGYISFLEGLRYNLTDAFYSANKSGMDVICRMYREFVQEQHTTA
jgi:hypothetical protein